MKIKRFEDLDSRKAGRKLIKKIGWLNGCPPNGRDW